LTAGTIELAEFANVGKSDGAGGVANGKDGAEADTALSACIWHFYLLVVV
jgi:hypothetical protein